MNILTAFMLTLSLVFAGETFSAEINVPVEELTETEKIEYLLVSIKELDEAVFIRNGSEHTPAEAARHMQNKLRRARRHIRTAEDFIRICATQSSFTGRKYQIRFSDGTTVTTADYLSGKLNSLEGIQNEAVSEESN